MRRVAFLSVPVLLWAFLGAEIVLGQSVADLTRKLERLQAYPDLIVVNAKIYTMDAKLSQAQAMAVRNNRILALGSNDEVRFLAGPRTEVLDARGRTVLPGLIDGHTHPHLWAVEHWLGGEGDFAAKRYNDPQLRIVYAKGKDAVEVLRALETLVRQRARELGPGKWIWVALFGGKDLPESRDIVYPLFQRATGEAGTITRQFLDTLAPNNPLMVFATEAIGPAANNTKAKQEMEKILGTEVIGLQARNAVTYDILFRGRTEDKVDFLKRELLQCVVAQGITTFSNHYYNSPSIAQIYRILYERGELPVRWGWWVGGGLGENIAAREGPLGQKYATLFYNDLGDLRGIGNDYIWNVGVSNEGWETGLTCTKARPVNPANPYGQRTEVARIRRDAIRPDCATPIDYEKQPGYARVKAALNAGLRIGFLHHYSDGTFDALFNLIEDAINSGRLTLDQVRALRISTEHTPIIRPDQVVKIARYNIMPAFNGYQVQGNIKGGAFLKGYGEQYMTWMTPLKSLADAGAKPVFNTDAHLGKVPVEAKDMDYPPQWDGNIWAFLEFFATRKMPHDGITYNRSEALDKVTLMKAATIWAAEQILNEKNIGSLETGKLADFILIDKDYFTIPDDQIHAIKTLLTVVGGKVVFRSPDFQ